MRKTTHITIDTAGRDQGKMFLITEMPASQAEAWATRLMLCLARGGVDVPPNFLDLGMEGIAYVSIRALGGVAWSDAKPLLDEMMGCIVAVPDPNRPQVVRALVESDIEEIATRLRLRDEVVALHVGFSIRERLWGSTGTDSETIARSGGNGTSPSIATSRTASAR